MLRGGNARAFDEWALALLACASVAFVVALNLTPVNGADFWIQLKVGDEIRETGSLPDRYEYAYTEAKDERYIAPNWLACLAFSELYRIDGYEGMIVVKCLLALCVFASIVALAWRVSRDMNVALALGCLALLGINFRCLLRPELPGFVFAVAELYVLDAFVRSGRRRWLIPLIPMSLVWANTHPSFLVSLAFPLVFAAGELGDALVRSKAPAAQPDWSGALGRCGWLALAALGMALATLVNPYGSELYQHLLSAPTSDFLRENIWEWHPVFHPRFRREPFLFVFVATVALVVVSGIAGRRKLRIAPLLLVVGFFPLALSAIRHLPWFEIAASYFLAHSLGNSALARRHRTLLALALATTLLAGTWLVVEHGNTIGRRPGFWNGAPLKSAPLEFIRRSDISGNVFHSYTYGDQLAYEFHPRIRIAMDTRTYSEKYYREYRSMEGADPKLLAPPEKLREYLERYDVRTIVTEPHNLGLWLSTGHSRVINDLGFQVVYRDRETWILRR